MVLSILFLSITDSTEVYKIYVIKIEKHNIYKSKTCLHQGVHTEGNVLYI